MCLAHQDPPALLQLHHCVMRQVDFDWAHIRSLGLATLLVLGHHFERRHLSAVTNLNMTKWVRYVIYKYHRQSELWTDLHQGVGARAHESVHLSIEGVVVRVSRYLTHSFAFGEKKPEDYFSWVNGQPLRIMTYCKSSVFNYSLWLRHFRKAFICN